MLMGNTRWCLDHAHCPSCDLSSTDHQQTLTIILNHSYFVDGSASGAKEHICLIEAVMLKLLSLLTNMLQLWCSSTLPRPKCSLVFFQPPSASDSNHTSPNRPHFHSVCFLRQGSWCLPWRWCYHDDACQGHCSVMFRSLQQIHSMQRSLSQHALLTLINNRH